MQRIPEILAPAGSKEALYAAIGSGADAVYLGLDKFNARGSADNFNRDNLSEVCELAHASDTKVYLTVNVVILPSEMQEVFEMVQDAYLSGIDAVIVQDLGLIKVLSETLPDLAIHVSTQANVHSSESLRALARYGVARVTLAREVSIDEIRTLVAVGAELGIEVEAFVHGAICICYSGQCYLSSFIGRRSANRGECAQPCRLPYELVDIKGNPVETLGKHLLSPKDLAGIELIAELVETGVASLKIEGRMKSASYVASAVSEYRAALDALSRGEAPQDAQEALSRMQESFSRGFSPAYLKKVRNNNMMSYERPNNRGVSLGRLGRIEGRDAYMTFDRDAHASDRIEIWTNQGRFSQEIGTMYVDDEPVQTVSAGSYALIGLERFANKGDRVFRVRSASVGQEAQDAIERAQEIRRVLRATVSLKVGEPLRMSLTDEESLSVEVSGPVVEQARTKAITQDEVIEHVSRLGGTFYEFAEVEVNLDEQVGIGFSTLHKIRKEALKAYATAKYFKGIAREEQTRYLPSLKRSDYLVKNAQEAGVHIDVTAAVATYGGAKAALNAGANEAYVNAFDLIDEEAVPGITVLLPRVAHDSEVDEYLGTAERFGSAVAATLGQLTSAHARGIPVQAHWSLNATNAYSVAVLAEMGASRVWLSPELSGRQMKEIAEYAAVPLGISVAGLSEVMVMEHCVLMAMGPCDQRCELCKRRETPHALKDRKGYHFRVITDRTGRSHLYNSVPLDLRDAFNEIVTSGIKAVRLDLETALTSSVSAEVARLRTAFKDTLSGHEPQKVSSDLTRGHFYRGLNRD